MPHPVRHTVTLALSLLVLSACQSATAPKASASVALAQAQARWNARGISDYSYEMSIAGAWVSDSMRVVVTHGVVTSAVSLRTPPGNAIGSTIPELFDRIRAGIDAGSAVAVTYDATYGYPVLMYVPDPPHYADYGWSARAGHFAPLQ